jgi:NTE family protein
MTIKKMLLLLILTVGPAFPLFSQSKPVDSLHKRPPVGLVLSGGGAKGFAYVGLLKVIRDAGLPIDYIGGTSIGSIVGSLYAVGYSPEAMEGIIRAQNWDDVLHDKIARKYVAYEEKEFNGRTILSLPIKNKKIAKSSMFTGQEIDLLLNHYLSPAFKVTDFRKLPTPFLCIGTDLLTGDPVVLDKGYLPMAVRASMSIPGVFSPVNYNGYYLADGGVVNNYPVPEVKEMGAGIIVGGDVQTGLITSKDQLNSITSILDQMTSFYRVRANKIGDSLTNLHVWLPMDYGIMDFNEYDSIIALGERVSRKYEGAIRKLADSLNAIEYRPVKKYDAKPADTIRYDTLVITGGQRMPKNYFQSFFPGSRKSKIALKDLEKDIRLMYGSGFFEQVGYEVRSENGKTFLVIHATEGGAGAVSAGIHFDNNYNGSILVNGSFRNILGKGSKLFANLVLSINPRLQAVYLGSFGGKAALGVMADLYSFKFGLYEKDIKVNTITYTDYKGSVFFNGSVHNVFNAKAGFDYEYFRFKQDVQADTMLIPYQEFSSYGTVFASLAADTRDREYFPTRGFIGTLRLEYVMLLSKNFIRDVFTNTPVIYLKYDQNIPLSKRFVLQPGLFAGALLQKSSAPPLQHLFALGGLNPFNYVDQYVSFTGVDFLQEFGYYAAVGRIKLQYNYYKKLYLTLRADAGASQKEFSEVFDPANFMMGYGVTASYDSFIGPIELTLMGSNQNPRPMLFLNIGFWF